MTKRELKKEIDQLRRHIGAEFVKRDKVIEAHTTHLETFHKLVSGWAKDLGNLDNTLAKLAKRVDWLEEVVGFLNCFQYGLMQACGVTDSQREIAGRIAKERHDALKKGDWETILVQTKEKYEAPKVEKIETTKPEADLFSSIERRRRAPETKDRYEGLISVDRMMRRTGKTYKEITEMAKARGLYIVKKKGHNFVRITDEIYYK